MSFQNYFLLGICSLCRALWRDTGGAVANERSQRFNILWLKMIHLLQTAPGRDVYP